MALVATSKAADFPAKLQFLFQSGRYKVTHGGRGGAKSWGYARALLLLARTKTLRILCARELQNSIAESVHKLLNDQIKAMGLSGEFEIGKTSIKHTMMGSEFFFEGLKHNADKIKSYEGIDIAWVEEAQRTTKASWDLLIPTIRKEGSEIWISFNPDLESDETYQRFVMHPPSSAIVVEINWRDNPWFPQVLYDEMVECREKNPDDYLHIWEGKCKQILDGAVYAQELRQARLDGRIRDVPYDTTRGVSTFWDLGWADKTSIWFAQFIAFEYRIIDFYENRLKPLDHYLGELQKRPYIYDTDWLPHDAKAKNLGTGRSIQELMKAKGRNVRIVPSLSIQDGINAARTIMKNCYFDQNRCSDGLSALYHYKYEVSDDGSGNISRLPVHDEASHGADGFRYLAIALKEPKKKGVVRDNLELAQRRPDRLTMKTRSMPSGNWMR